MLFENYLCGSERNYTGYCNPELEKLFHQQSMMTDQDAAAEAGLGDRRKLQEDGARPVIYHGQGGTCWWPHVKGCQARGEHDLQSLALRRRLAGPLMPCCPTSSDVCC